MKNAEKGFSIIEGILIIIIIAIIGFVGWKAFDMLTTSKTITQTQQTETNTAQTVRVDSAADLDKADSTLNSTNIDGTESSQLTSETNF